MFSAPQVEWLHRWRVFSTREESNMFGHHTIGTTLRAALVAAAAIGGLAVSGLAGTPAQAGQDIRFTTTGSALADTEDAYDGDGDDVAAQRMQEDETQDEGIDRGLVRDAQWGPPHGNAWGHRRHRGWDDGWGHRRHWGPPRHHWGPRCRTVWERRYDPWRGWSSYPVRRCW